jgi:uncharacterized OB-fold protein
VTTRFEPPASEESAPFWEATRDRRLLLPWCTRCERAIWYPRTTCPVCLAQQVEWRDATGGGVIHAVSVHRRPGPGRVEEDGPYVVAFVDLEEGVRMLTNIVNCEPDVPAVGDRVHVSWIPLSDGRQLPCFELIKTTR